MALREVELQRNQLLDQFVSGPLTGLDRSALQTHRELLHTALSSVIFGPTIQKYMETAIGLPKYGAEYSVAQATNETIAQAFDVLAQAAINSEHNYSINHPGVMETPDFLSAMKNHHAVVESGDIKLISPEYAMTRLEGKLQVQFADEAFSALDSNVQLYLAGLNYATFTQKTMYPGIKMLSGEFAGLDQWSEKGVQEAMPHLVISNIAMGELVAKIYQVTNKDNTPLRIVDTGSGTGSTLAGNVLGLIKGRTLAETDSHTDVGIAGIDSTKPMFEQLREFNPHAIGRLNQTADGVRFHDRYLETPESFSVEPGELLVVNSGIEQALNAMDFGYTEDGGLTVITANYSWHRLSTATKERIIESVLNRSPNTIFMVADLVENGSEVNRRYFDLRDNGLLNCGNIPLGHLFAKNGMSVFELNADTAPDTMDERLAKKIGDGVTSDAVFYVAYKGDVATKVIDQLRSIPK